MISVVSHEYDEATGIDHYVLNPGNMDAMIRVVAEDGGEPQVLLGVETMTIQSSTNAERTYSWTKCANKFIAEIALETYKARQ